MLEVRRLCVSRSPIKWADGKGVLLVLGSHLGMTGYVQDTLNRTRAFDQSKPVCTLDTGTVCCFIGFTLRVCQSKKAPSAIQSRAKNKALPITA